MKIEDKMLFLTLASVIIVSMIVCTTLLTMFDKLSPNDFMKVIIALISIVSTLIAMANKTNTKAQLVSYPFKDFIRELMILFLVFIALVVFAFVVGSILLRMF